MAALPGTQVVSVSYSEETGSVADIHVVWEVNVLSVGKWVPMFRRREILLLSGWSSLGRVKPEYRKDDGTYLPDDEGLLPHKTRYSSRTLTETQNYQKASLLQKPSS